MNEAAVKKLADLSRLELTNDETLEYAGEFSSIIEYIDSLKEASTGSDTSLFESSTNRNVVREDVNPMTPGKNTEKLLKEAPETKDGYIKVKKVL